MKLSPNAEAALWQVVGEDLQQPDTQAVSFEMTPERKKKFSEVTSRVYDLLKANTDYALVGYMSNTALAVVGIKGSDTGNLRICGPGSTQEFPTTDFFGYMGDKTGRPYIPVINAANVNNTFVSVAAATASVAAVVELIFLQLTPGLS